MAPALRCADGTAIEVDVIVGADGIHSAVRAILIGPDAPRFTGKVCWRFLLPVDAVKDGEWSKYTLLDRAARLRGRVPGSLR